MNSNSIAIVERELSSASIEGVDFGPKLWVIARSPTAMLIWIYGHSWSNNGHRGYAQPHLCLLPDRTPRFMHHPTYHNLGEYGFTRLTAINLAGAAPVLTRIIDTFGQDAVPAIIDAVQRKKTVVIDGGGGSLAPLGCHGEAWREWKARGGGFITLPEGMTEWDACRGKLGWHPKEKAAPDRDGLI